jgi:hypothetical protein
MPRTRDLVVGRSGTSCSTAIEFSLSSPALVKSEDAIDFVEVDRVVRRPGSG